MTKSLRDFCIIGEKCAFESVINVLDLYHAHFNFKPFKIPLIKADLIDRFLEVSKYRQLVNKLRKSWRKVSLFLSLTRLSAQSQRFTRSFIKLPSEIKLFSSAQKFLCRPRSNPPPPLFLSILRTRKYFRRAINKTGQLFGKLSPLLSLHPSFFSDFERGYSE